jgi:hypothetical protein
VLGKQQRSLLERVASTRSGTTRAAKRGNATGGWMPFAWKSGPICAK